MKIVFIPDGNVIDEEKTDCLSEKLERLIWKQTGLKRDEHGGFFSHPSSGRSICASEHYPDLTINYEFRSDTIQLPAGYRHKIESISLIAKDNVPEQTTERICTIIEQVSKYKRQKQEQTTGGT